MVSYIMLHCCILSYPTVHDRVIMSIIFKYCTLVHIQGTFTNKAYIHLPNIAFEFKTFTCRSVFGAWNKYFFLL